MPWSEEPHKFWMEKAYGSSEATNFNQAEQRAGLWGDQPKFTKKCIRGRTYPQHDRGYFNGPKPAKHSGEFAEVLEIIRAGRARAFEAVNVAMIDTYWTMGALLSSKPANAGWSKGLYKS
jgi:hypothetical protein